MDIEHIGKEVEDLVKAAYESALDVLDLDDSFAIRQAYKHGLEHGRNIEDLITSIAEDRDADALAQERAEGALTVVPEKR